MTRVSTESQAERGNLAARLAICRDYAERQGWEIVAEYPDAISGATPIRERPAGSRCYADAQAGLLDVVVIDTVDRAARDEDALEYLLFKRDMKKLRVVVHFADTGESSHDPMLGVVDYVRAAAASKERQQIIARTSRGRTTRAEERRLPPNGQYPWGYRPVRDAQGRVCGYEIDGDAQRIVHRLTELFLLGFSYAEIRRRSPPGWTERRVQRLFQNPFYLGKLVYLRDGQRRVIAGNHPAMWDEATCRAVSAELALRAKHRRAIQNHHDGLLSGLVYCGQCGRRLCRVWQRWMGDGSRRPAYGCIHDYEIRRGNRSGLPHGGNIIVETKLLRLIARWLAETPDGDLAEYERAAVSAARRSHLDDDLDGRIAELDAQIAELDAATTSLGGLARAAVEREAARLRRDLESLLAERTSAQPPTSDAPPGTIVAQRGLCGALPDLYRLARLRADPDAILRLPRDELRAALVDTLPPIFVWQGQIVKPPDD